jgi:uncharacterized repeat protein (TIGR03803 family)
VKLNLPRVNFRMLAFLFAVFYPWIDACATNAQEEILYRFQGGTDGALPSGLVADKHGNLYGTTNRGGLDSGLCQADEGCGTVFQLRPPSEPGGVWSESVIYDFGPFAHPLAGVTLDAAGNLYGAAPYSGTSDNGIVFELKPPAKAGGLWTESTLYSFAGGEDGSTPVASLVFDRKGNLYGTTEFGGGGGCTIAQQGSGCGTVFELTPPTTPDLPWTETVLYRFAPFNDYPMAGLIFDSQGNLYGTTAGDQSASFGTVFELTPPASQGGAWNETTLYLFGSSRQDGITPYSEVIFDKLGNLYGTTNQGGNRGAECRTGCGTVFELSASGAGWTESILYSFVGAADGAYPYAGVIADDSGNLYGTTFYGGSQSGYCQEIGGCGTVFLLRPPAHGGASTETVLYRFVAGSDGQGPQATLTFRKRSLLGTTTHGGGACAFPFTCGTVFELLP